MEVQKPGYQLVSLLNPLRTRPVSMSLSPTHLHQLCLLPNQTGIYTHFCGLAYRPLLSMLSKLCLRSTRADFDALLLQISLSC